jgi:hypothetical protein
VTYKLTLHVNGPTTHGDLTVTGFSTARTATQVGGEFADALRYHYQGATITTSVDRTAPACGCAMSTSARQA